MKTNWARDIRVNYQLLRERFEPRLCLLKGLGEKIRWSATSRPSLVHKHQSIRVVSATAIWPTSDLGPRIDRPPFVIPLRDILSFLAECRVISRGKRRAQEFHGYSSPILLLPVLGRFEENHLHHISILETRNTWLVFGNSETIFIILSSKSIYIAISNE